MCTDQQPAGPADTAEVVRQALTEPSFWRSRQALHSLSAAPPLEILREGLAHGDATVRRRTARLLAQWAAQLPEMGFLLRQALRDPSWPVRRAAVQGLAADSAARGALLEALADADSAVREAAAEALAGADALGVVEALGGALADDDEEVRLAAARALGRTGGQAVAALEALRAALRDESDAVRIAAARALEGVGVTAAAAETDLVGLLAHERRDVRLAAVRALGEVGGEAAGQALLPLLGDEAEAAEALGKIGGRAAGLQTQLLAVVEEGPGRRRQAAARALARLGSAAARERLAVLLRHRRPRLRRQAALALAAFAAQAEAVLPDLQRALADSHSRVRQAAAAALAGWGVRAVPALALLLRRRHDRAARVRVAAAQTLAGLLPQMPAGYQRWLGLLAAPGGTARGNLRRALAEPNLPEDVRREFLAACLRRLCWHAGHGRPVPETPPASAWKAARQVGRTGGAGEYAWLTACLWSLLQPRVG